jgi:hypothetical protein
MAGKIGRFVLTILRCGRQKLKKHPTPAKAGIYRFSLLLRVSAFAEMTLNLLLAEKVLLR